MSLPDFYLTTALWLLWLGYWVLASGGTKPLNKRESSLSRTLQTLPISLGGLLLLLPDFGLVPFDLHFAEPLPALGLVLVVAGLLFTVWARRSLGANWSAEVSIRTGHELVRAGPYRWVRHPIYTGGLIAVVGTALEGNQWRALIGLLLVLGTLAYKLRLEERWLVGEFGDAYSRYQAEVAALIPRVY